VGDAERLIGAQFDILDKAVADRTYYLLNKQFIYPQEYDSWRTSYSQLATFARQYSGVPYVQSQWAMEAPRYAYVPRALEQKIRTANPDNYDTRVSVSSGTSSCGCGTNVPALAYSPIGFSGGSGGFTPGRGGTTIFSESTQPLSLGDMFRDLFSNKDIPSIEGEYPESKFIDQSDILKNIITAVVVAGILYLVHRFTMKKG
jgi:hypothetical protein